jgi:hypothetical protein
MRKEVVHTGHRMLEASPSRDRTDRELNPIQFKEVP